MPLHKHKKKKKSHKRSKRHSSSSSEDTCSSWRVPLSDAESDSDESSNVERLTPLVRRTYVKHLKQALTSNFQEWTKGLTETTPESIDEMVLKWSSVLEQKAMRTCMISELYRTSMASLIRQIKTSTNDRRLYIEDKSISGLNSRIAVNKLSQTDPSELTLEAETQTDLPLSSLLELSFPKSRTSDMPYDPAIEFSDSNSSDGGVSSSLCSKQTRPSSGVFGIQDMCNISSTSDVLDIANLPIVEDSVRTVNTENNLGQSSAVLKCEGGQVNSQLSNSEFSSAEPELERNINAHNMNSSEGDINICQKRLIMIKRRHNSSKNLPPTSKNNLDERLLALGLSVDTKEESLSHPSGRSKKSNWFAEEIAQSCNLTRILMRMTTRQREKVFKRIKDLFGEENGSLTELSEENIGVCRKRIASVVVMELTPVYQAKKIASRHLFKFLAKKITRSIMEKTLAPDTKSIRWRVKKYFEDGKIIMSETDCM